MFPCKRKNFDQEKHQVKIATKLYVVFYKLENCVVELYIYLFLMNYITFYKPHISYFPVHNKKYFSVSISFRFLIQNQVI